VSRAGEGFKRKGLPLSRCLKKRGGGGRERRNPVTQWGNRAREGRPNTGYKKRKKLTNEKVQERGGGKLLKRWQKKNRQIRRHNGRREAKKGGAK